MPLYYFVNDIKRSLRSMPDISFKDYFPSIIA